MINNITMKNNMDHLIQAALREDISSEDISTNSVIKEPPALPLNSSARRMGL